MSENKNPVDHLLDIFVFAPLGLAMSARELLPTLIDKGRQQLTGQVSMAKMVGQFAVQQGQTEAAKRFDRAREQATTALEGLGVVSNGNQADTGSVATQTSAPVTSAPATPPATPAPVDADATTRERREAPARPEKTIREAPGPSMGNPPADAAAPPASSATTPLPTPQAPAPAVSSLAIPDYDSLSASQVVPRLSGLSASELADVRAYESATRARKTILNKIAQLQAG